MSAKDRFEKKRLWESTAPGPERLKLGLNLIDETKDAFTTQQEEINALHRAQERAETRVSEIHEGLKESEEELRVLERELQDIDTLDRELHELTHEKSMLEAKVADAEDKHAVMQAVSDSIVCDVFVLLFCCCFVVVLLLF